MGTKEPDIEQFRIIRQVLDDARGPLNVSEILEVGQRLLPRLRMAIVERAMKEFTQKGWLRAVEFPVDRSPRYELSKRKHHHHFLCGLCDRMFDVESCSREFDAAPMGFDVLRHEVLYFGSCAECGSEGRSCE